MQAGALLNALKPAGDAAVLPSIKVDPELTMMQVGGCMCVCVCVCVYVCVYVKTSMVVNGD